jgi:hypothetical protein
MKYVDINIKKNLCANAKHIAMKCKIFPFQFFFLFSDIFGAFLENIKNIKIFWHRNKIFRVEK